MYVYMYIYVYIYIWTMILERYSPIRTPFLIRTRSYCFSFFSFSLEKIESGHTSMKIKNLQYSLTELFLDSSSQEKIHSGHTSIKKELILLTNYICMYIHICIYIYIYIWTMLQKRYPSFRTPFLIRIRS